VPRVRTDPHDSPSDNRIQCKSGFEVYDRLSPSFAAYLETLTAHHEGQFFRKLASALGNKLRDEVRGHPLNQGDGLEAIHPVIRVNPVTGSCSTFQSCLPDIPS
jgi:hypothetical protein